MAIPIIGELIDNVKDLVSEVVVDKDKRDQVNLELRRIEDQAQARLDAQVAGQIEVNKAEASHGSVFVAGWRPAIGWVGAVSLAYTFILSPLMEFIAKLAGWTGRMPDLPVEYLMTLVTSMLGIGAMRTFEKVRGVATNDYTATPAHTNTTKAEVTLESGDKISLTPTVPNPPVVAPKRKWSL